MVDLAKTLNGAGWLLLSDAERRKLLQKSVLDK